MDKPPKVSVILPVYNVEKYLRECLDSVCGQTLHDIEIICVDDGSTDASLEILREYSERDSRVTVLTQKNDGAGTARNKGLDIARGEYLSFLDSDDFFYSTMLEEAVNECETYQSDITAYDVDLFDDKEKKKSPDNWVVKKQRVPLGEPFDFQSCPEYTFSAFHTCAWNKLFRASFIKKHGLRFQQTRNTNDLFFVCMAMALAERICYLAKPLMAYRVNNVSSLSGSGSRRKNPDDAHTAFACLKEGLLKHGIFERLRRAYDNQCLEVYYYNLQHMEGASYIYYAAKLSSLWLPELELAGQKKDYFFYPHLYKFQREIGELKLFSFDIFDTLITRKTATPRGVFLLAQRILCEDPSYRYLPETLRRNFCAIRMETERFMYQKVCTEEKRDISLDEIYSLIARNHALTPEQSRQLSELEISMERKLAAPVTQNLRLLEQLVEMGCRVVLISDMYLPGEVIRSLLAPFSEVAASLPLFVSCERNAKKHNGLLYEVVQKELNIPYDAWLHFGDNERSDIEQAKKHGITVQQYRFPGLKPYERYVFDRHADEPDIQLAFGLARMLRAQTDVTSAMSFGIGFGGPFLFPYVRWVLGQAQLRGIHTLYFVARDGYILQKIAEQIIQRESLDIETYYIYGSRLAWRDVYEAGEREELDLVAAYLEETMDLSGSAAFVEYAGTGGTQDCLAHIIREYGLGDFAGTFYLYHSRSVDNQFSPKFSWFPLNENFGTIIELLVRAPHGQTLGYERTPDGTVVPVLDEMEGRALQYPEYTEYIQGVELYARAAAECGELFRPTVAVTTCYMRYLRQPDIDREAAAFLGRVPFVLDGLVDKVREYAPPLTMAQVEQYYPDHTREIKTLNLAISEIRSPEAVRRRIAELKGHGTAPQARPHPETGDRQSYENELRLYKNEVRAIKSSWSFRIGQCITFIPRKARGLVRCCREHGLRYTLRRAGEHLKR